MQLARVPSLIAQFPEVCLALVQCIATDATTSHTSATLLSVGVLQCIQALPELLQTQFENSLLPNYMFGLPPLTPAAILAAASHGRFPAPAVPPQYSEAQYPEDAMGSLLQAYLQATVASRGSSNAAAAADAAAAAAAAAHQQIPYQQQLNTQLHCEEAVMWNCLQNLYK